MENTKIAWTGPGHGYTFNPVIGCSHVNADCLSCYAEEQNARYKWNGTGTWGPGTPRHVTSDSNWRKPLAWNRAAAKQGKRAKVFCASLADVFDAEWPEGVRERLWDLIRQTPNLDWLLLSKRPGNFASMLPTAVFPNVWLGVSCGSRKSYPFVDILRQTPAIIRFLSMEPLLGDVSDVNLDGIDWVITGGESGRHAREMQIEWARSLRDRVIAAGKKFFMKQLGAKPTQCGKPMPLVHITLNKNGKQVRIPDLHAADITQFPSDLQIQTWPGEIENPTHERSRLVIPDAPTTSDSPLASEIVAPNGATLASSSDTMTAFLAVETQVYAKVDELTDVYRALQRRFEVELLPLVDKAQAYLSIHGSMHVPGMGLPPWAEWRDAFLNKLQIKMSARTLQRKLKRLRDSTDVIKLEDSGLKDGDESGDEDEHDQEPEEALACESPKELISKRLDEIHKLLVDGPCGPVDANSIRDGERRISLAIESIESVRLAIDDGLLDGAGSVETGAPLRVDPETTEGQEPVPLPTLIEGLRVVSAALNLNGLDEFKRELVHLTPVLLLHDTLRSAGFEVYPIDLTDRQLDL